jgi:DNA-directed RNA polymerase specialized sigma24 family protein
VADLTEPEIAKALGVARGTVATTLRRAHMKLAEELGSGTPDRTEEFAHAHRH